MPISVDERLQRIAGEVDATRRFAQSRDLAQAFPREARVWLQLARAALEVRRAEPAFAALEQALCLDLRLSRQIGELVPQFLAERITALDYVHQLHALGDHTAMVDHLRRLALRYPDYTPILFNYAVELARAGSLDLAREAACRAVAQSPMVLGLLPPALCELLHTAAPAVQPSSDPRVGAVFGGYRVLRVASQAPSHVLYDAVHTVDQTAVTLRHMLDAAPDKARALFLDQVAAAAAVHDAGDPRRHLVRALGVVDDGGVPLQVLERIHGRTVYEAFAVPPDDLDIGINLVWLVARAAAELHERCGFLHGRLGPDNVLFVDDNIERPVRLLDTGLDARLRGGTGSLPVHLAPDHAPSPEAEVYGLGVLLYYVLTGALPARDRPALDRLPAQPERLRLIVARCLAPVHARYASAALVASELESVFVTPVPAVGPGAELDDWRIDAMISDDGGCANVYRAEHRRIPGRIAALKVLNRLCVHNRDVRHRFELEAAITPRHPGIVEVWPRSSFLTGTPYFAMELLSGQSLRGRIAAGRIPLASALDWALELVEALCFTHERGVVHRDLKPDNVFVLKPGGRRHVKLLDFGIAKVRSASLRSRLGVAFGTPAYMAPEQLVGSEQADQLGKIDVYALGVVMTEMLTGVHTLDHNANRPYRPIVPPDHLAFLDAAIGGTRRDLEYALGAMTAERPEDRPSMQGVLAMLQQIARHVPGTSAHRTVQVAVPSTPPPSRKESPVSQPSQPSGKLYSCEQGHRYVEGTDEYRVMMRYPKNAAMREPWICPADGSALVIDWNSAETAAAPAGDQFGLLVIAADVSGSMFRGNVDGRAVAVDKARNVAVALAATLRGLALPSASTAGSLLVGIVVFGERAAWVDISGPAIGFAAEPRVMLVSELVTYALRNGPPLGTDRRAEAAALSEALFAMLSSAEDHCGGGATSYSAALDQVRSALAMAQDHDKRQALRPSWDAVYEDSAGLRYLRTFFYSDGQPNRGLQDAEKLRALCGEVFPNDHTPLMIASFLDKADAGGEARLTGMASTCPRHRGERCLFPGTRAHQFREIIKMASGGAGFCQKCLEARVGQS